MKQRDLAIGTPAAWAKGLCRIAVTLPDSTFELVKMSAMMENRSISAEIRTRIERQLREEISNSPRTVALQGSREG